jgi:glycosyltransferase involved in cell wall biosynthesis
MRILALTTLYPCATRPSHGIFVESRLRALAERGHDIRVVAPVPYFPIGHSAFGRYGAMARAPRQEERHGIRIEHPRYLVLPKIGMTAACATLEQCFRASIRRSLQDGFGPDLIDAHYYYPDGVAAARAAAEFDLPVCVTARGSDVTLLPKFDYPRRAILSVHDIVDANIAVAEALRSGLIAIGLDGGTITTIRNGVDTSLFAPEDSAPATTATLLSVGHLIPRKGHDLVIRALSKLPQARLYIVGEGPERRSLERLATRLGLADRVRFAGQVPHGQLVAYYNSADVLVLASDREGCANVLLEAMACGTPCVATDAGGNAEVLHNPDVGTIVIERTSEAIAAAVSELLEKRPSRVAIRKHAEALDWEPVAEKVEAVWHTARRRHGRRSLGTPTPLPAASMERVPCLLTVDTEELFDWAATFGSWEDLPASALVRLQSMAECHGYTPLYFATFPILSNPATSALLADWVATGRAAAGLHLHTWSTPPNVGATDRRGSFQLNIDPDEHRRKLTTLAERFEMVFGVPPRAHRAGRYGVAPWILEQLSSIGVLHDFSPTPGFDYTAQFGPSFADQSPLPRRRPSQDGTQWVFPVSGGRVWRRRKRLVAATRFRERDPLAKLSRTLSAPVRLTPEGNDLPTMQALTRELLRIPGIVLTPTLHSSSLVPGANRYGRTPQAVETLCDRLDRWLAWSHSCVQPVSLEQLQALTAAYNRGNG